MTKSNQRNRAEEDFSLLALMVILANVLGLFAIHGPMNISFSLTALPILVVAFSRGWRQGAVAGLLGGIVQAQQYGSLLYVFYTFIMALVAAYLSGRIELLRSLSPPLVAVGGFFMFWHMDLAESAGGLNLEDMTLSTPYRALIAFAFFYAAVYLLVRRLGLEKNSMLALALAGFVGVVAYIPYDALVMLLVQKYSWVPTWILLAKDLLQDYLAALLCALILQSRRARKILGVK